jgi:membrane glycosyltransferase
VADALMHGPDGLSAAQKLRLIGDRIALSQLHTAVWTSAEAHPRWREASGSAVARSEAMVYPTERVAACVQ